MQKRGVSLASICLLCKRQGESLDHIFLFCPFAARIWSCMAEKFDLGALPGSLLELLFKGLSVGRSHQLRELWTACYSSALWFIWQTRNKCRFNGIVPSDLHACRMINTGYVNASSHIASGSMFNTSQELCIVRDLEPLAILVVLLVSLK